MRFRRGVKRKSDEYKPKKESKKKLNQNADDDNGDNDEANEDGGKQNKRKKSRVKLPKERKLDKVKAWRQSTVKEKTADFFENDSDDNDDFQLEGNGRENRNNATNDFVGEVNDAAESFSENLKCQLDGEAEIADLNFPNDVVDDKFSKKFVNMRIEYGDKENRKDYPAFDEDDDFICTQNISTFLPRSTPKRGLRPSFARPKASNSRRGYLDAAIPLPPTCGDLDALLDSDLKDGGLFPESKVSTENTENRIAWKHNSPVLNINANTYCNGDAKSKEPNESEKVISCSFEELRKPSEFNEIQVGSPEGFQVTCCENKTDKNFGDISNLDLFGDSLIIDSDDEFDDCPSPPVVAQIKTNDAKSKIIKAKSAVPCMDGKDSVFIMNAEDTKKNASIEVDTRDNARESLSCLGRDKADNRTSDRYRHNSVNCLPEADEMDLQLADYVDESSSETQLPILSLKSRIRNRRCESTVESTRRVDADVAMKRTVEKDQYSNNMLGLDNKSCPSEPIRDKYPNHHPVCHADKMAESMLEYDVDEAVSIGRKSSEVCNGSVPPPMLDRSSESNSNDIMPSLATRLKNRDDILGRDGIGSSKDDFNVNESRSTGNVDTNTRQFNSNPNSICKAQRVENMNKGLSTSSHVERESPVFCNKGRRRRGNGRITDDSPSPVKEISICSSGDELDNIILRRKKTKKVGVFKSPPVRNGNESSDEDFESGRPLFKLAFPNKSKCVAFRVSVRTASRS